MDHTTARGRVLAALDQCDAACCDYITRAPGDEAGRAAKAHAHILWAIESLTDPTAGPGPVRPTVRVTRDGPDPEPDPFPESPEETTFLDSLTTDELRDVADAQKLAVALMTLFDAQGDAACAYLCAVAGAVVRTVRDEMPTPDPRPTE